MTKIIYCNRCKYYRYSCLYRWKILA